MSVTSGSNDVMPGSGLVPVAADLRTTDEECACVVVTAEDKVEVVEMVKDTVSGTVIGA